MRWTVVFAFMAPVLIAGCTEALDPSEIQRIKGQEKQVYDNMRVTQLAAEHYAADHDTINYPTQMDDVFKTYFPGGAEGRRPAPVGPVNPFTGINEFPLVVVSKQKPEAIRDGKQMEVPAGQIQYMVLQDGKGYAIIGGGHDNKALLDETNPKQLLLFSNFL